MKKFCLFICVAALCTVSCSKASQPVEDTDKWVNDESQRVPVQFASRTQVETKAINYGRIEGNTMNNLDVGVIAVAEKLAVPFELVRVDLYNVDGRIVFSELTFHSGGGLIPFEPKEYDREFGKMLGL